MGLQLHEHMPWLSGASPSEMARVVEALYRLHRLSSDIADLDTLLNSISEESRLVAGAEGAAVMLYDNQTDELYFRTAVGDAEGLDTLKEVRLTLEQGIAGATARERHAINVEDAQKDPRFFRDADAASQFQTRNLLAVPMIDRNELVGVLEVVNKVDGRSFTDLDVRVMEIFSSLAARTVVTARLLEEHLKTTRLAAIGQAVTGLSHYTKNIVTALTSSADLIDMGMARDDTSVLKRSWPVFKRSTKRIANFVQDMLSFSKPREPVRERCPIDAIISEAHLTFAEVFARKDVEVNIALSEAPPCVLVDSQSLYRCLLNLLTNAADAVSEGDGVVTLTTRESPPGTLEICVSDNGPGVPEDIRERIFDPFFSTKGSRGTGLGLAVTRKIILEHGGTLEVFDAEEGGALFRILLPGAVVQDTGSDDREHPLLR